MKLRRVPLARRCVPFSSFPDSTSIQQESSKPSTINAINHELFNTFKNILSNMHNNEAAGSALNTPMVNPSFSQIKPNRPLTMVERQIEIEEKQHSAAVTEQAEMISSLRQLGRGTSLKRVQRNLVKWYEPLTEALQEEIRLIETNAPGGDRTVSIFYGYLVFFEMVRNNYYRFSALWTVLIAAPSGEDRSDRLGHHHFVYSS